MKKILITGCAGFIGFHLALKLKKRNDFILGLDNFNNYYDPSLKVLRAKILKQNNIDVVKEDIQNQKSIEDLLEKFQISHLVHLAAQPGVRHSFKKPQDYIDSNIQGVFSILEVLKNFSHIKLIYASSSSVYGLNQKIPFGEEDQCDRPANLYGATKKANETMVQAYHHLYGISAIGLRYFSVYGPWGRPDMAYFLFSKAILEEKPIQIYNHGSMSRDYTYIDDIVEGTISAIDLKSAHCEIFNLGNQQPIDLLQMVSLLEKAMGKKAKKEFLPKQPGEVLKTFADICKSQKILSYQPKVEFEKGILKFVKWFKESYASHLATA